jgi:NADH-quinone oxidoreductase subunit J
MLFLLYTLIILSSILIITSKNTVSSVLYLILVFLLCSLLFIYLGADFIGLIILIVYIGAIAVLFLFVVMMLNIRLLENSFNLPIYIPIAIILSLIFIIQIIYFLFNAFNIIQMANIIKYIDWSIIVSYIQIILIGQLLFNKLYVLFIGAAFLLFIAMIGAIILTMEEDIKETNRLKLKKNEKFFRFDNHNINWKYIR